MVTWSPLPSKQWPPERVLHFLDRGIVMELYLPLLLGWGHTQGRQWYNLLCFSSSTGEMVQVEQNFCWKPNISMPCYYHIWHMLYSVTTHPHKNVRKGWKMVPWPNLFHGLPKQVSSMWTATNVFVTMPSGAQHWFVGSIPENQQQWGRRSGSMEDLKFPLGLGGGFKYFICSPHFGEDSHCD